MTAPTEFKFAMEPTGGRAGFPLLRFEAVCKEVTPVVRKDENDPSAKERQTVKFDFVDLTVIDTVEPYPFPIISFSLPYSDRAETIWMEWAKSFRDIIPATAWAGMAMPFKILEGKKQVWAYVPGRLRRPITDENGEPVMDGAGRQKWGVQDADTWKLVSVEGFGGTAPGSNIHDLIIEWIDGKNDKDFMQWLFTDMSLKTVSGHQAAVEAQAERKLLPMLVEAGKLTLDDSGVYHKVG